MNLSALLPPLRAKGQPVNTPGLLMNSLLAASRHDEFMRLVGWKGMAVCSRANLAWTMRLRSRPGIYGLGAEAGGQDQDMRTAALGLYYFPAADEALLERMSLAAHLATAQPDYLDRVRAFSAAPDWAAPFRLGAARILFHRDESAMALQLRAFDRKACIAMDGVATDSGDWLVAPGEPEEDIPAQDIAMDLFLVLCAAMSNSLGERPARYGREEAPSAIPGYTRDGRRVHSGGHCADITHSLAWGDDAAACELLLPLRREDTRTPDQTGDMPHAIASALLWKIHDLPSLRTEEECAFAFDTRPRLIVLSGFLGSGKTTFLNQLLEYHASRDELVAIIQNEVGQTGVDGKLLEGDDSIVEMDEGCVCCTLAGNLSRGIEQLTARFSPKVIVLESTGLANPFNILREINTLRPLVRLDSITTLVDAVNAPLLLDTSDIATDQIKAADIILLNKCDLVSEQERVRLAGRIRALNARALVAETEYGAINPATLYDSDPFDRNLPEPPPGQCGHAHHTHAMEGFTSRRFAFGVPLDRDVLVQTMERLLPCGVFRLKGIVAIAGLEHAQVVQYVAGRHEFSSLGKPFDDQSFLVAIGKDMDLSPLEALQEACA